jgi:predicted transcriptional regulator
MKGKNEETSRAGSKWSPEEDEKLVKEFTDKKTFEEIALEHKRNIGGIKSRIISHILYKEYKDGTKTIDDLSKEYNIEIDLLNKYINKLENKNNVLIKSCEEKPKITMMLLFEKMLTIEQKLDDIMLIINRI